MEVMNLQADQTDAAALLRQEARRVDRDRNVNTFMLKPNFFTARLGLIGPLFLGGIIPTISFLVLAPVSSSARPNIRDAFFAAYPSAVGSVLDTVPSHPGHCGVCHMDFSGAGTRTPYGNALKDSGFALNTTTGRANAINSQRGADPDKDGFSTDTEVTNRTTYANTPTFPGLTPGNVGQVLNVAIGEIQGHLVPSTGADTTPPTVTVTFPNGGQTLVGNRLTNVTWTASDNPGGSGIAAVSVYLSLDNGSTYEPLGLGLANTGTFAWVPANRPATNTVRIRVVATDNAFNTAQDQSDAPFTITPPPGGRVPTTLRDFDMPGTQPFGGGPTLDPPTGCASCHGNYNPAVEPYFNWQGSMMAHASIDPLFEANLAIANQDAPDSGDLCLRCHISRGWLAGRSVPTDGSGMLAADKMGVSCDLCHRMVDPVFTPNVSPAIDSEILSALTFADTNAGNGMFVVDPFSYQRGPFGDPAAPHAFLASPFHRKAAICGTCHDVSNPAFQRDEHGNYVANAFNTTATDFSPHSMGPVERTYSEWLASEYNTPAGVYAPQFAGNKADGRVTICQDCHMRDVAGHGCDPAQFPTVPLRPDIPLHDMTGGSTWLPALLTNLYPGQVNAAAVQAGIQRAVEMLTNAAPLVVGDAPGQLKVTVTNETGHKLPTGYPEGRRIWINVKFYNDSMTLLSESGAYDPGTGVLTHDDQVKIYEVHPGMETNLANALGLPPGPSLHFVLNNRIYEDNRIPPRGFNNAAFAAFGGAPVGHHYEDGQYWDDTLYTLPPGATRAEVRLYYQSTSKEFVEFLRDENRTNSKGQEMYELWATNGMCPPTLMAEAVWVPAFELQYAGFATPDKFRLQFRSRPGVTYTVQYKDSLDAATWQDFAANGTRVASATTSSFEDDFTFNTSGGPPATGARFYRISYTLP